MITLAQGASYALLYITHNQKPPGPPAYQTGGSWWEEGVSSIEGWLADADPAETSMLLYQLSKQEKNEALNA
ncbi:MAG: hypothetical protein AAFX99_32395, partial [Myxococcota bacterium]